MGKYYLLAAVMLGHTSLSAQVANQSTVQQLLKVVKGSLRISSGSAIISTLFAICGCWYTSIICSWYLFFICLSKKILRLLIALEELGEAPVTYSWKIWGSWSLSPDSFPYPSFLFMVFVLRDGYLIQPALFPRWKGHRLSYVLVRQERKKEKEMQAITKKDGRRLQTKTSRNNNT